MKLDCSTRSLLQYRVEFWQKRLDHTLSHTQTASKLIYLVDGGVLAFIYFTVTTFGLSRQSALFVSSVVLLLSCLNFLHARFIRTQQHWYAEIANRLLSLLREAPLPLPKEGKISGTLFTSSHRILSYVHVLISLWLLVLSILLVFSTFGAFSGLNFPSNQHKSDANSVINNFR